MLQRGNFLEENLRCCKRKSQETIFRGNVVWQASCGIQVKRDVFEMSGTGKPRAMRWTKMFEELECVGKVEATVFKNIDLSSSAVKRWQKKTRHQKFFWLEGRRRLWNTYWEGLCGYLVLTAESKSGQIVWSRRDCSTRLIFLILCNSTPPDLITRFNIDGYSSKHSLRYFHHQFLAFHYRLNPL